MKPEYGPKICSDEFCGASELQFTELDVSQESRLEDLVGAAERWATTLDTAREDAVYLRGYMDMFETNANRANPGLHMQLALVSPEDGTAVSKADYIATLRNHATRTLNGKCASQMDGRSMTDVLKNGRHEDVFQLKDNLQRLNTRKVDYAIVVDYLNPKISLQGTAPGTFVELNHPYPQVFIHDIAARAELAMLLHEMPEVMYKFLQPDNLDSLPEALQQLIALDIESDKDSIVLQFMRQQVAATGSLFEYLHSNNLPANVKTIARAIKLGSRAVGDCDCPLNGVGLCANVADRIPSRDIPQEIYEDMTKQDQNAAQQLQTQLRSFAQDPSRKISAWWNPMVKFPTGRGKQVAATSRKRGRPGATTKATQAPSFDKSIDRPFSAEPASFSTVGVSWPGAEAVLHADVTDEQAVDGLIEGILDTKMFAKYLQEHRESTALRVFVADALKTILIAPVYRNQRGLRPIPEKKRQASVDGQLVKLWRLSGAGFHNGAGKAGADTRIFWGSSATSNSRRVELLKVAHKADLANALAAGRSVV